MMFEKNSFFVVKNNLKYRLFVSFSDKVGFSSKNPDADVELRDRSFLKKKNIIYFSKYVSKIK